MKPIPLFVPFVPSVLWLALAATISTPLFAADKPLSTTVPQTTDDAFDLQLRATKSLSDLRLLTPVGMITTEIRGDLAVDTSAAYTNGNVLATCYTLTNAVATNGGSCTWQSFMLVLGDDQTAEADVYLFKANPPSLTAANTLFNVSQSDLAAHLAGSLPIAASDWRKTGTNRLFVARNIGQGLVASPTNRNLYLAIRWQGTLKLTNTVSFVFQPILDQRP